ncbi:unnamed protein product [Camellia sinensis]
MLSVVLIVMLIFGAPSLETRKLLGVEKKVPLQLADTLVLTALPKGIVPPSSPSGKGHAMVIHQRLFSPSLAQAYRVLESKPSPEADHSHFLGKT